MTKGGHARSGPAPDPGSQRQQTRAAGEWRDLDPAGRKGRTPPWPLPGEPDGWEARRWRALWRTPQAVVWEEQGLEVQVGLCVRSEAEAADRGASAPTRANALKFETDLGLNQVGMRANRWRIRAVPLRVVADRGGAATDLRGRLE